MKTNSDANRNLLRNRLLLYLSGAGADPLVSLELTAECLRRLSDGADGDTDCAAAMNALDEIVRERNLQPEPDHRLRDLSLPPMTRSSLLACDLSVEPPFARALGSIRRVIPGSRT